jgi:RecA/RadA recombinase
MSDFLNNIIKVSGNKYASVVSDGIDGSDVTGFINSGSFIFNALVSGSLYGGFANNKITAIAGESATGKTYFALSTVKTFLDENPTGIVLYFDTEQAITSQMISERGIDTSRIAILPVATIEEFRHQAISIVDEYLKEDENKRKPMFVVLDSLGMLSTSKEMVDTSEGKETRDMTRAQIIKATFRVLTLKLGVAKIPLIITNHVYASMGMFPTTELSGGNALKYAASTIVFLSKKKEKDASGDVIGNIIHCKLFKGRFTKENKVIDVRLNYETGLDRYYGLVDLALESGVFTKTSTRITLPDGSSAFEKNIYENPEKYFTKEVLEKLEKAAQKEFKYGSNEH